MSLLRLKDLPIKRRSGVASMIIFEKDTNYEIE